jgi:peptidoglycan/xylan/chitin deacetylase (PgdA/CDA1 family)
MFIITSIAHSYIISNIISIHAYSQKAVILNFDDDWKNQYVYVEPILKKYGFNATFYLTPGCIENQDSEHCNNSATPHSVLNWTEVKLLQKDGYDIQSHGMSHKDLTSLSNASLEYEIKQSKKDLLEHGINSTIFGNAFAKGENNLTVIKTISKYYDMARAGYGAFAFLKCNYQSSVSGNDTLIITIMKTNQKDCRTFSNNGSLTLSNKYSIPVSVHYDFDNIYNHNSSKILPEFIKAINSQTIFNNNGEITAIPILVYHNIDYINQNIDLNWFDSTTDVNLFDKEMKFLHDNNIAVLTMDALGYNQTSKQLFLKK